ncbi:MAG: hypothetical protein M3379_11200 [Acidobacteriota bacterium]|nr:hypothetical protein [Acidobacteriota bacterium]
MFPEMMPIPHGDRRALKTAGFAFLLVCSFTACAPLVSSQKAEQVEKELEQEFNSIKPLPGAYLRSHNASYKSRQALVGSTYSTEKPYSEIRKYYDEELANHGWKFHEEYELKDWGRDFGGRTIEYCKGGYKASLQYAGTQAHYGWVFALDLSWGLDSLVDEWKGNVCKGQ